VTLDEESIGRSGPDIEHERAIAIYDPGRKEPVRAGGRQRGGRSLLHLGITGKPADVSISAAKTARLWWHICLSLTPVSGGS